MNKFETIKETGSNNEKMSIGQIMDNLLENPAIMIKQFSKMLEDCRKIICNITYYRKDLK